MPKAVSRIIISTAPTDGGIVTYEYPGFGRPNAAIVLCDYEPSATLKAYSVGYFDGDSQFVGAWASIDNSGTTDTYRSSSTEHIVSKGTGVTASAVGWSANGLTIDWDVANAVAGNVTVILIKGVTAKVFSGVFTFDGTEHTKTLGFRPTYIDIFNTNETSGFAVGSAHIFGCRGFVHFDSSETITQACIIPFSQDSLFSGVQAGSKIRNDACASIYFNNESAYISATAVTATGWKYQSNTTQTARYMAGLALGFPDHDDVNISIGTTASSAENKAYTGQLFSPEFVQFMGVKVAAINTDDTTSNTLAMFNGVTDGIQQCCYSFSDQDGLITSNANQSFDPSKVLSWTDSAGAAEYEAIIAGMDSQGVRLAYSLSGGQTNPFVIVAFGDRKKDKTRGGLFLPDKFVREPALLIPGRKPVGPVEIDWEHPLTRGLAHCIISDSDLVAGARANFTNAEYAAGRFVSDSTSDMVTFSPSPIDNVEFSAAVRFKSSNTGVDNVIFGTAEYIAGSNNNGWAIRQGSSGNIELDTGAGSVWTYSNWGGASSTAMQTLVGVFYQGSVFRKLYIDGVDQGTPDSAANASLVSANSIPVGLFSNTGGGYFGGKEHVQGQIEFAIAWSRLLTHAEVQSFTRNPYQFITPA